MRHFATVSMSKFVGSEKKKNYATLTTTLHNIVLHAKQEAQQQQAQQQEQQQHSSLLFVQQVEELISRLVSISSYEKIIAQNWVDEESTADIYVKISNDYVEAPDLRLTWLDNLALVCVFFLSFLFSRSPLPLLLCLLFFPFSSSIFSSFLLPSFPSFSVPHHGHLNEPLLTTYCDLFLDSRAKRQH